MFYKVSRASYYSDTNPPCDDAVLKSFPYYESRAFSSFELFDKVRGKLEGAWLSKGTEHKVTEDGISRRLFDFEKWVIRITSLKQLQEFIKKYGKVIIDEDSIIIYDAYVE